MQGHIITLEITSGQTYRGKLLEGTALLLDPLDKSLANGPPSQTDMSR